MKVPVCWTLAALITITSVFFQRGTGPTHPLKAPLTLGDTRTTLQLPRSLTRPTDPIGTPTNSTSSTISSTTSSTTPLTFEAGDPLPNTQLTLHWRRLATQDPYQTLPCTPDPNPNDPTSAPQRWTAHIPTQPTAAKITYYVTLTPNPEPNGLTGEPINTPLATLRFKNHVPAAILILHILCMFLSLLITVFTGCYALTKAPLKNVNRAALWTLLFTLAGGLIFGPLVQRYAFGALWNGWPVGQDLTDTKTLLVFLTWLIAFLVNRIATPRHPLSRKPRPLRLLYVAATLISLAAYAIPHSTAGSTYDYEKQEITTGF